MRVLMTTLGAAGDHLPLLGVARALAARGHGLMCALDEPWRTRAEALGLEAVSLGPAPVVVQRGSMTRPVEGSIAFLRRAVIPRVPAMVEALERASRAHRADVILGHHISLGAPWAARRLGIPWAMACVAPASWTSLEQVTVYPGMPDKDRYSPRVMRGAVALGKRVTNALVDPLLNRHRRALGLPVARGTMFNEMFSGIVNLGLWHPVFRAPAADDAPRSTVCGFVRPPELLVADPRPGARVRAFLERGAPPIVITLGTSVPHAAERFFARALSWCAATGTRAVLLTGGARVDPSLVPPCGIVEAYIPLEDLLPRASAVVHHGGLGTIAAALRAGVPMVCVPHLHDQFDNAARCRRLGVSVTVHRRHRGGLGAAIARVTGDPSFRSAARTVQAAIAGEDGANRAAEELERAMGA